MISPYRHGGSIPGNAPPFGVQEIVLIRYIDGWYNPRRIQVGPDGLSPDEYEDAYHRHTRPDPHR
jgi:transposase InsO family protein